MYVIFILFLKTFYLYPLCSVCVTFLINLKMKKININFCSAFNLMLNYKTYEELFDMLYIFNRNKNNALYFTTEFLR